MTRLFMEVDIIVYVGTMFYPEVKGRFPSVSDECDTARLSTAELPDSLNTRFSMLLYVAFTRPMSERVSNRPTGA